jgi:hypothetical protein
LPRLHPDLKIISSKVFRGPNVWHHEPAIQLVVDLGVLEDFPTNKLPGFGDALLERLPGLMNHNKELTLALLSAAGLPVPRSQSVRSLDDAVRLANRIGYPVGPQAARR